MSNSDSLNLVIVGAGGFAAELRQWLWAGLDPATHRFRGYLGEPGHSQQIDAKECLGDPESYTPQPNDRLLLAIGDLATRRRITASLLDRGGRFASFIHPSAVIAETAVIGQGAVIYPFAVVANGARLGKFTHLSNYASVGHDAVVGDNCYLAPYATLNGAAKVGNDVLLGSHSCVGPRVTVGSHVQVVANSSVLQDAPDHCLVAGVPGRAIEHKEPVSL